MITHLRIEDFGIISAVDLQFQEGFTVLTGETGAGKSMIIDAIGLLLGQNANESLIQTGKPFATIEAQFTIPTPPPPLPDFIDPTEPLIIYRKISRTKDHQIRINSQSVSLKILKSITPLLINIIGQHEHMQLLSDTQQLRWLDAGDTSIPEIKSAYTHHYQIWKTLEKERQELLTAQASHSQNVAFLEFQHQDISSQDFKSGEEEHWLDLKLKLKNSTKSMKSLESLQNAITTSQNNIEIIQKCGSDTISPTWSNEYESIMNTLAHHLQLVGIQITEIEHLHHMDIEHIEERLDKIYKFKTKYNQPTLDALIDFHIQIQQKLATIEHFSDNIARLTKASTIAKQDVIHAAHTLTQTRQKAADRIAPEVTNALIDLHFTRPSFTIQITAQDTPTEQGMDQVSFLLSPHPGTPLLPIAEIASGGELSRIMLALKTIFSKANPVPTLIFDEVDTGVGGLTANKIGDYLHKISDTAQVFCITHLPQIARLAHHHLVVSKHSLENHTETQVKVLSKSEQKEELHRMVGGEPVLKDLKKN